MIEAPKDYLLTAPFLVLETSESRLTHQYRPRAAQSPARERLTLPVNHDVPADHFRAGGVIVTRSRFCETQYLFPRQTHPVDRIL